MEKNCAVAPTEPKWSTTCCGVSMRNYKHTLKAVVKYAV
jgi:hypothetical protein